MRVSEQLILASASSRRKELLSSYGVKFTIRPQDIDETPWPDEKPEDYVVRMAMEKARACASDIGLKSLPVLGADTVICFGGRIIGKPQDQDEAFEILRAFSGQSHEVLSAVAVANNDQIHHVLSVSKVQFRRLQDQEILAYCKTGEPLDKAGAYGIQGLASMFISRIEGSYTGIVGLPVFETLELLSRYGITPLSILEQHTL